MNTSLLTSKEKFELAKETIKGKIMATSGNQIHRIIEVKSFANDRDIRLIDSKNIPFAYFCNGAFFDCCSGFKYELK